MLVSISHLFIDDDDILYISYLFLMTTYTVETVTPPPPPLFFGGGWGWGGRGGGIFVVVCIRVLSVCCEYVPLVLYRLLLLTHSHSPFPRVSKKVNGHMCSAY